MKHEPEVASAYCGNMETKKIFSIPFSLNFFIALPIDGFPYLNPISTLLLLVYFLNFLTNLIVFTSKGEPSSVQIPLYFFIILEGLKGTTIKFTTIHLINAG